MAASNRRTTIIARAGADARTDWPEAVPAAPTLTLAQWLVNVNEDLAIRRFSTGVALWRLVGDAERRAAAAGRLELALLRMTSLA